MRFLTASKSASKNNFLLKPEDRAVTSERRRGQKPSLTAILDPVP